METKTEDTLMDIVEPIAREVKRLDERIRDLNGELADLKTDREKLSDDLVSELNQYGIDVSVGLPGGGTVHLVTKTYITPNQIDLIGLEQWAIENNIKMPNMQFNAATISAWYSEQIENNQPVPSVEVMKPYIKTRAKVNK